jgi:hypothetical protein
MQFTYITYFAFGKHVVKRKYCALQHLYKKFMYVVHVYICLSMDTYTLP